MVGIKHFDKEFLKDIGQNPVQYTTSLLTGMFTYFNIPLSMSNSLLTTEIIKSFFSVLTALIIFLILFVVKKIAEPYWEQKLKDKVYKFFNLNK